MRDSSQQRRLPFFAPKFLRLVAAADVANALGANGCWLLAVIVNTEDGIAYRHPVTFFNAQLLPVLGLRSEDALARLRAKVVAAGWLSYTPGRKGVPGTYRVQIPAQYQLLFDASTGKRPGNHTAGVPPHTCGDNHGAEELSPAEMREQQRRKCGDNRGESAEPSSLPFPLPQDDAAPQPTGEGNKPSKMNADHPKAPTLCSRDALFEAIAEVTHSDPVVNGSEIGKLRKELAAAEPPYTPEEVRRFADPAFLKTALPWMRGRLSIGLLRQNIKLVRSPAGPSAVPERVYDPV